MNQTQGLSHHWTTTTKQLPPLTLLYIIVHIYAEWQLGATEAFSTICAVHICRGLLGLVVVSSSVVEHWWLKLASFPGSFLKNRREPGNEARPKQSWIWLPVTACLMQPRAVWATSALPLSCFTSITPNIPWIIPSWIKMFKASLKLMQAFHFRFCLLQDEIWNLGSFFYFIFSKVLNVQF